VKSCVFWHVGFESDKQQFSLRGVKIKKISSHPGRDLLNEERFEGATCLHQSLAGKKRSRAECHLRKNI